MGSQIRSKGGFAWRDAVLEEIRETRENDEVAFEAGYIIAALSLVMAENEAIDQVALDVKAVSALVRRAVLLEDL